LAKDCLGSSETDRDSIEVSRAWAKHYNLLIFYEKWGWTTSVGSKFQSNPNDVIILKDIYLQYGSQKSQI